MTFTGSTYIRDRLARGMNFQEGAGLFEVQANRLPLSQSLAPIAPRIHKLAIGKFVYVHTWKAFARRGERSVKGEPFEQFQPRITSDVILRR